MGSPENVVLVMLPSGRRGRCQGTNLLEAARQLGVELESICAGRQTCGKCQVIVESGAFAKHGITSAEDHLSPAGASEEAYCRNTPSRAGGSLCGADHRRSRAERPRRARRASRSWPRRPPSARSRSSPPCGRCMSKSHRPDLRGRSDWSACAGAGEQWGLQDLEIEPPPAPAAAGAAPGRQALTASLWRDRLVLRVQPGYAERACGLAIDVGSTTVVVHLCICAPERALDAVGDEPQSAMRRPDEPRQLRHDRAARHRTHASRDRAPRSMSCRGGGQGGRHRT